MQLRFVAPLIAALLLGAASPVEPQNWMIGWIIIGPINWANCRVLGCTLSIDQRL